MLRQVHPQWRSVIDTRAGPRLLVDETGFCAKRVHAMLHWLGGEDAAVPWARALSWWRCLCKIAAIPGVTVAGSAALFVEHLNASRDPGFSPGDIDVWMDPSWGRWTDEGYISAVVHVIRELRGRLTTLSRFARNGLVENVDLDRPVTLGKNPGVLRMVARNDIDIQLISQGEGPLPDNDCRCKQDCETCMQCISMIHPSGYSCAKWNSGMPHRRFDIDVACVALRWQPLTKTFKTHRLSGDPAGDTINIMALGVWRNNPAELAGSLHIVEADRESMRKRLCKYRDRGYSKISVAPRMFIHVDFLLDFGLVHHPHLTEVDGRPGVYVNTPEWLLEECKNISENKI